MPEQVDELHMARINIWKEIDLAYQNKEESQRNLQNPIGEQHGTARNQSQTHTRHFRRN